MHVRDLDALDRAERRRERQRGSRLVRVDMDLERRPVADDEQGVTELLELRLERVGIELVALDDEDRAVAEGRELLVDRVDPRFVGILCGHLRHGLAGEGRRDAAHDLEQAGAAGIDDTRLAEHGQLLGRAGERLLAARDEHAEELENRQAGVGRVLPLLGELPDHGQHRSLDGSAHSAIGGIARAAEGAADPGRIDRSRLAQHLCGTADDLGEDHPRVSPRAHQRGARQLLRHGRAVGCGRGFQRLDDRLRGEGQVGSRVAVRDGIDVQVVDPAAVRLERRQRPARQLPGALQLCHADLRTSWM